jgi:N-acetyl-1-D-myo-inositol-2-amino-2-deoxy-alpha-D-glucopyranoside deacetylase
VSGLLLVHAHPDDESITSGGVMAQAHDAGKRVVLVTCTGGEAGEIHNMDEAAVRPRLAQVRAEELRAAGGILGVDRIVFLGYRDSGMLGTADNRHPQSFHVAPTEEAAEKLAVVLREERPEVVVTYGADGLYNHPDHVKAHLVTVSALDLLAREDWQPEKFYFAVIPRSGLRQIRDRMKAAGLDSPFDEQEFGRAIPGTPDEEITTIVDVTPQLARKKAAFEAHRSQLALDSFFLNTPRDIFEAAFGREAFVLARGFTGEDGIERDLFAGLTR